MEGNNRSGILVKDLLLKLLIIIAFVFLLVYFFPTKNSLKPLFQDVFRNNLNSMKEGALSYFTNDKLPKELDETIIISLDEMLEKKLLVPFVDEDGRECDGTKSFVAVTRLKNEYEMKVNLSCPKQDAYIFEHMGCRNLCSSNNSNNIDGTCPTYTEKECPKCPECKNDCPAKPKKCYDDVKEYQFKKLVKTTKPVYKCDSGYKLVGDKCTKQVKETKTKTQSAAPKYEGNIIYADKENKVTTTYDCPNETWTKSGSGDNTICTRKVDKSSSTTQRYCSDGVGLDSTGTKCQKSAQYTTSTGGSKGCDTKYQVFTKQQSGSNYRSAGAAYWSDGCGCTAGAVKYYPYYVTTCWDNTYTIYNYYCTSPYGPATGSSVCSRTADSKTITTYGCTVGNPSSTTDLNAICTIKATKKTTTSKVCPTGYYEDNKGKCYKTSGTKIVDWVCPNKDWIKTGSGSETKCTYKYTVSRTVTKDAKKTSTKSEYYEYKWSKSSTLKGWTSTGKSRTTKVEVKCKTNNTDNSDSQK